jgi:SAM-dependent methyltransferase
MKLNLISDERAFTSVQGTGVQYLPGHIEDFVDLIIKKYIPQGGNILELGGGGLRFAIPACEKAIVKVVDLDPAGLEICNVMEKVKSNGKWTYDENSTISHLSTEVSDALVFLRTTNEKYDLIVAFRLLHFLTPEQIDEFFLHTKRCLKPSGIFVFSGFSFYELPLQRRHNTLFENSAPAENAKNIYFRKFQMGEEITKLRAQQNIGYFAHFFDNNHVAFLARKHNFRVLLSGFPSTGIVEGYILSAELV